MIAGSETGAAGPADPGDPADQTTAIGFAHLPHNIAGTVDVLAGAFASAEITFFDFGRFLAASTLGNAIGGSVFVSLLKDGHVVRSGPVRGED